MRVKMGDVIRVRLANPHVFVMYISVFFSIYCLYVVCVCVCMLHSLPGSVYN